MFKAARLAVASGMTAKQRSLSKQFVTKGLRTNKASSKAAKLSTQALKHIYKAVTASYKSALVARKNKLYKILA